MKGAAAMIGAKCGRHGLSRFSRSTVLGIASLSLLLESGLSWAGPPNPTQSDSRSNTAGGTSALVNETRGALNTAFGFHALIASDGSSSNSAFGSYAMRENTTGVYNSAFGYNALLFNTGGGYNSAFGSDTLVANTTGA